MYHQDGQVSADKEAVVQVRGRECSACKRPDRCAGLCTTGGLQEAFLDNLKKRFKPDLIYVSVSELVHVRTIACNFDVVLMYFVVVSCGLH